MRRRTTARVLRKILMCWWGRRQHRCPECGGWWDFKASWTRRIYREYQRGLVAGKRVTSQEQARIIDALREEIHELRNQLQAAKVQLATRPSTP